MKNHGLFAFVLTTAVLVPAAAHYLTAGHDQIAKFAAGSGGELTLNGATVKASLDHPLVDPGKPLTIKLAASGAKGKRLEVGVLVYGSAGDEGDRVPSPPVGVAYRTVTITIDKEGTGTAELAVPLKGAAESRYNPGAFTSYEVLVMAPRAAEKLERLRRSSSLEGGDEGIPYYNKAGQKFMSLYHSYSEVTGEDAALFGEGAIARLDAHTRAINPAIALTTPDTTEVGKAFTVAVTVTNPTKKATKGFELSLETPLGVVEDVEEGEKAKGISALVMPENVGFELAAGETKRFEFRVMPSDLGVLGLYAHVSCHGEECPEDGHPLTAKGTFDATEILKATVVETPSIVGSK